MSRLRVTALAAASLSLTAAACLSLTACDTGPECLDYDTQIVPSTTVVNGKVVAGTTAVSTCVRYAEDEK